MEAWKNIRNWSRGEMLKRVARFKKLKGSDGGLPDSKLPECRRKLFAVSGIRVATLRACDRFLGALLIENERVLGDVARPHREKRKREHAKLTTDAQCRQLHAALRAVCCGE